jgi:hypothetical protein
MRCAVRRSGVILEEDTTGESMTTLRLTRRLITLLPDDDHFVDNKGMPTWYDSEHPRSVIVGVVQA